MNVSSRSLALVNHNPPGHAQVEHLHSTRDLAKKHIARIDLISCSFTAWTKIKAILLSLSEVKHKQNDVV